MTSAGQCASKSSEIYYQLQKHASVQLGSHKYPNQGTTDHGRPRDATGSLGYGISEKGFWDLNFATLGPLHLSPSANHWPRKVKNRPLLFTLCSACPPSQKSWRAVIPTRRSLGLLSCRRWKRIARGSRSPRQSGNHRLPSGCLSLRSNSRRRRTFPGDHRSPRLWTSPPLKNFTSLNLSRQK